jgi:glycosyltransferase involved in cell wall biosynthesis
MHLAYVCADLGVPVFGRKGCSIHVQEMVRALLRQGVRVDLFAARCEGERPAGLEEVALNPLPAIPKGEPAVREQAALAANPRIAAALERAGPFDILYERYSLWSFGALEYARGRGAPTVLEVNAPLIEEQARHRTLVDRAAAEEVARRAFAAVDVLVAVSAEVAAYLESFPQARGRVHVVPNGVDPARFPDGLRPSQPGPAGSFTVGFVGTLKPWHGLGTLVEAFALLRQHDPHARLLIVGDGPGRADLEADLAVRGLRDAAELVGAMDPADIPGLLASMDVGVAPYPAGEGFYFSPLKVYEYMAAGLPVVASRLGQLAGLIRPGENGLLCPPGDAITLAEALGWLRRRPALRRRLGEAARRDVLREHTWDAVVRRVLELTALGCGAGVGEGLASP